MRKLHGYAIKHKLLIRFEPFSLETCQIGTALFLHLFDVYDSNFHLSDLTQRDIVKDIKRIDNQI